MLRKITNSWTFLDLKKRCGLYPSDFRDPWFLRCDFKVDSVCGDSGKEGRKERTVRDEISRNVAVAGQCTLKEGKMRRGEKREKRRSEKEIKEERREPEGERGWGETKERRDVWGTEVEERELVRFTMPSSRLDATNYRSMAIATVKAPSSFGNLKKSVAVIHSPAGRTVCHEHPTSEPVSRQRSHSSFMPCPLVAQ